MRPAARWDTHIRILRQVDAAALTTTLVLSQPVRFGLEQEPQLLGGYTVPYWPVDAARGLAWWAWLGPRGTRDVRLIGCPGRREAGGPHRHPGGFRSHDHRLVHVRRAHGPQLCRARPAAGHPAAAGVRPGPVRADAPAAEPVRADAPVPGGRGGGPPRWCRCPSCCSCRHQSSSRSTACRVPGRARRQALDTTPESVLRSAPGRA